MDNQVQECVFIRGIPGSGKSTRAKKKYPGYKHVEADMFFINPHTGAYEFNPAKIAEAHQWAQNKMVRYIKEGHNVVVSNTFTKLWELNGYKDLLPEGTKITIERMTNQYGNIHKVPDNIVEGMKQRFEPIQGETLIK